MALLATWSSRGAMWKAELYKQEGGWRLAEFKHGAEVGAAWRPEGHGSGRFETDEQALAWAWQHVRQCFDVEMRWEGQR